MLVTYRRLRRRYLRPALWALLACLLIDALRLNYRHPPTYRTDPEEFKSQWATTGNVTVYIASVHRNTEKVQRAAWNRAVLNLVDYLGPENVYVSAVESGSQDGTKAALKELKGNLIVRGISHTIDLGGTVWDQIKELNARPDPEGPRKENWIWNENENRYEMRRIPYLSRVRNQALEPLRELEQQGIMFDKVLWLNDVVFDTEDIVTLLNTRDGEYGAACSMDFKKPPLYYDTFALRDFEGLKTNSLYWPWFQSSSGWDNAELHKPVPVKSCWNGIVVFDTLPFYTLRPLQFRGIPDSLADYHLEGSECCLIHADNPISDDRGVYLNPNVRVAYSTEAYGKIRHNKFPDPISTVLGIWANRVASWKMPLQSMIENAEVAKRVEEWKAEGKAAGEATPRHEPGWYCLINEKQVMWSNGWKHL